MASKGNQTLNFRFPPAQIAELDARCSTPDERGEALRLVANRYFALLADGRRRAARILTPGECGLVCDAMNGVMARDTTLWVTERLLALSVESALEHQPNLAEKWEVQAAELVAKLKHLDPACNLALLDAVERYWLAGGGSDPREILR